MDSWFASAFDRKEVCPIKGCWLANPNPKRKGYAFVRVNTKVMRIHRLSYERFHGAIPTGLLVCHKCDVRNCWNPDHLFLGTAADNNSDMLIKGRNVPPPIKATPRHVVAEIRDRFDSGESPTTISQSLGMKYSTVYDIGSRRNLREFSGAP